MITSQHQINKLGRLLRRGEARITGRVSLGQRWPDQPHAWIVENLLDCTTHHVYVADRPTWKQYEVPVVETYWSESLKRKVTVPA